MSLRILVISLVCLALSWANGVNSVEAQFVRKPVATTIEPLPVTYADPVEQVLIQVIGWLDGSKAKPEMLIAPPEVKPEMLIAPPDSSRYEPPYVDKSQSSKTRAIEHRLRQPISLSFKDVPLRQAAADLTLICGVPVVLDMASMDDAKINIDAPISITVENINLKSALRLMLNRLRLTFIVENEAIMITTPARGEGRLRRVTYPVADLVVILPTIDGQKTAKTNEAALIELITSNVAKNTWESMGGPGTIEYFPFGKALIVNQAQEIQEEVALLLATLRRLQDLTVSAEVRFVHTSPATAEQCRKELAKQGKPVEAFRFIPAPRDGFVGRGGEGGRYVPDEKHGKGPAAFATLSDLHVRELLEIAQGDRASSIIQAPKMNILNGQSVPLECVQKEVLVNEYRSAAVNTDIVTAVTLASDNKAAKGANKRALFTTQQRAKVVSGWRCELQPVVSPDRRHVRLAVNVEHFDMDEANSVERTTKATKTFNVPDASTLVWDLGATGQQHLFVLITPRVHVREEEERIFLGEIPPIPGR